LTFPVPVKFLNFKSSLSLPTSTILSWSLSPPHGTSSGNGYRKRLPHMDVVANVLNKQ